MVVDFHTHAFPDRIASGAVGALRGRCHTRPFTDGTRGGLASSMKEAEIQFSVLQPVATNPEQVPHVNDSAIRVNDQGLETGILSFGCMHPDFPGWREELGRLAGAGVRGIKLHPVYQGVDIDDPRYLRILDRAGELGLAVLVHAGWDIGLPGGPQALPQKMLRAIRSIGPTVLVLAHMGGWRCWDEAEELLCHTGARIDTAFSLGTLTPDDDEHYRSPEERALLDEGTFLRILRSFGANRVLFGTDSPWDDQVEALRAIRALPLAEDEREAVLWGNAARLLGLSETAAQGTP